MVRHQPRSSCTLSNPHKPSHNTTPSHTTTSHTSSHNTIRTPHCQTPLSVLQSWWGNPKHQSGKWYPHHSCLTRAYGFVWNRSWEWKARRTVSGRSRYAGACVQVHMLLLSFSQVFDYEAMCMHAHATTYHHTSPQSQHTLHKTCRGRCQSKTPHQCP